MSKVIVFGVDGLIPELVYKFSKEQSLPYLSQMMSEGYSTELLPFISTWGDVNWVSFLTGQSPGLSWKGQGISPLNSNHLLAHMKNEGKKYALVHFPDTLSAEGSENFAFAPFWSRNGHPPFELAAPTIYTTTPVQFRGREKREFLGWPYEGTLAHHEKGHFKSIQIDGDEYQFTLSFHNGSEQNVRLFPISSTDLKMDLGQGRGILLTKNSWSEWIELTIHETKCTFRFKLLAFDPDEHKIDLLQTQINRSEGISNHHELEQSLLKECGPFISKWTVKAGPDEKYRDTSFEEGEYQALWLANAALHLINHDEFDLFATVFRLNDETHHTCIGEYDPISPFYTPERADLCEQVMRRSYEVLDRAVGLLLQHKSKDTVLIVASDHGNVPNSYLCDIYRRLEETDLCYLDEQRRIIWEKSKAFLKAERGGLEIFVNLQGREPNGIVDPIDYATVQTDIFRSLTTWYHSTPDGEQNVVALTLKKQDAGVIGYGGEDTGDVIFAYNQGFVWGFNQNYDIVAEVTSSGANHGPQIPSASTNHTSNYGIALFHGPGISSGSIAKRPHAKQMNDVGTTIAHWLGISDMDGIDGRVIHYS